jgi:hypothetical protein
MLRHVKQQRTISMHVCITYCLVFTDTLLIITATLCYDTDEYS